MSSNRLHADAALRRLAQLQGRPFFVREAARLAGVPGKTAQGAAQKLRRLERAKAVPVTRRSLISRDRVYGVEDITAIARALREAAR